VRRAGSTSTSATAASTWIGVGTLDLFHDEDVAYAERLRAAGVPVELEIVEGGYHGFDAAAPGADVSRAFRERQLTALRRHLSPTS
jgi:acetyl esterase/lipase